MTLQIDTAQVGSLVTDPTNLLIAYSAVAWITTALWMRRRYVHKPANVVVGRTWFDHGVNAFFVAAAPLTIPAAVIYTMMERALNGMPPDRPISAVPSGGIEPVAGTGQKLIIWKLCKGDTAGALCKSFDEISCKDCPWYVSRTNGTNFETVARFKTSDEADTYMAAKFAVANIKIARPAPASEWLTVLS